MIKLMPTESGSFHNFKCGEVYCLSTQRYDISCCLCGIKVDLSAFPKHFQDLHISRSHDSPKASEPTTSAMVTRAKRKAQVEDDPLFPNQAEFVVIKPESIDEESAFSWNDNFDADELPMDVEFSENVPKSEEKIYSKTDPDDLKSIGEMGARTDTIRLNYKDDEINIGIKNHEWLHEKYSYENVPSDDDDSVDLEGITITDIEENRFESDDESDDPTDKFFDIPKEKKALKKIAADYVLQAVECEYCKRIFNSKIGLKIHTTVAHHVKKFSSGKAEPPPEFPCTECGEKFVTERNLITHRYKHTGIFCDVCGKTFSQIGNMERHRIRHTGIKTKQCQECEMSFFTDRELNAHMIRHTGVMPVICEICGKRCRDQGVLTAHMRRHTGERPAKCNVCGKSFFCGYDLNVHSVTHTTERPFKCDICGSTFQLKKSLRVHKKIHIRDRDHVCKICGKAFGQANGLTAHMRMHDGVVPICAKNKFFETADSADDVTDVAVQASNAALQDVSGAHDGAQWGLGML